MRETGSGIEEGDRPLPTEPTERTDDPEPNDAVVSRELSEGRAREAGRRERLDTASDGKKLQPEKEGRLFDAESPESPENIDRGKKPETGSPAQAKEGGEDQRLSDPGKLTPVMDNEASVEDDPPQNQEIKPAEGIDPEPAEIPSDPSENSETVMDQLPADEANGHLEGLGFTKPYPFEESKPVEIVKADEPLHLVRVSNPEYSSPEGAWSMPASELAGKTPEQIRDEYSLSYVPTHITDVTYPEGTLLFKGTVAPNGNEGTKGGGTQYFDYTGKAVGDFQGSFSNTRALDGKDGGTT